MYSRRARVMTAIGCAAAFVVAPTAPSVASAATAATGVRAAEQAPLIDRLLTPSQFAGYQVYVAPEVQPKTTTTNACEIADPKGSTTALTALAATTKVSSTKTRVVAIYEQATEFADAATARAFFAKVRASVTTCKSGPGSAKPTPGVTSTTRFVPTGSVPGASHSFGLLLTTSGSHTAKGQRTTVHTAARIGIYRAGRYIVVISATRSTITGTMNSLTEVSLDDAFSRTLATRAATKSIALLTAA